MNEVTYICTDRLLKRLYWPAAFLLVGAVLVMSMGQYPLSTVLFIFVKPFWIIAPFLTIAVGAFGLISAVISFVRKLPRLTMSPGGLKLERFPTTWHIAWQELGPFELPLGGHIQATIVSGQYKSKGKLSIPDLNVDKTELFRQLVEWQDNTPSKS